MVGLSPLTNYLVEAQCINQLGQGNKTNATFSTYGPPSIPGQTALFQTFDSKIVQIKWNPPSNFNAPVSFQITYILQIQGKDSFWREFLVYLPEYELSMERLMSDEFGFEKADAGAFIYSRVKASNFFGESSFGALNLDSAVIQIDPSNVSNLQIIEQSPYVLITWDSLTLQ